MVRLLVCLFLLSTIQEEPVILWDEDYKLNWSDFKAAPRNLGDAVATTASGITFGFSIKEQNGRVIGFTTSVKAHFYPEHSWYKKDFASPNVLAHEQLHFDITELFVRKFRQRIMRLTVSNNIKKDLQKLRETIEKELAIMQDAYDFETNFSRQKDSQKKWQAFIEFELNKLSDFKNVNAQ